MVHVCACKFNSIEADGRKVNYKINVKITITLTSFLANDAIQKHALFVTTGGTTR